MSREVAAFELPKKIDQFLATISKLYERERNRVLQELIVNAKIRIHEGWSCDNWNGGTYGHALYLIVPESIFLNSLKKKDKILTQIKDDLNKVHNIQNEFIGEVFLELENSDNHDWRKDSGLLIAGLKFISASALTRVWDKDCFRVFLSHKSEVKKETADLKNRLRIFGISCFVAHEDIHPTKLWQDEIENALSSMDGFVALMTPEFHDSYWTDQEVGFALARGIPLIAVRLGKDPYGFIGKFQGLSSTWQTAAEEIVKILIKHDRMFSAYIHALQKCQCFDDANTLAKVLSAITSLSTEQIEELVIAFNENDQLNGSFAFRGSKPLQHGPGLVFYLNKLSSKRFRYSNSGSIEEVLK